MNADFPANHCRNHVKRAIVLGCLLVPATYIVTPRGFAAPPATARADDGTEWAVEIERLLDLGLYRLAEGRLSDWSAALEAAERRAERPAPDHDLRKARQACLRTRLELDSLMYSEALESAARAAELVNIHRLADRPEWDQLWLQSRLQLGRAKLRNELPGEAARISAEITAWLDARRAGTSLRLLARETRRAFLEHAVLSVDLSRDVRIQPPVRVPRGELNELRNVLRGAAAATLYGVDHGNPKQARRARDEIPWLARDFETLGTANAELEEWPRAAADLEQTVALWKKFDKQPELSVHAIRASFRAADFWRRAAEQEDDVALAAKYYRRMAQVLGDTAALLVGTLKENSDSAVDHRIEEWQLFEQADNALRDDRAPLMALGAAYEACLQVVELLPILDESAIATRSGEDVVPLVNERAAWRQESLWLLHNLLFDMAAYDTLAPPPPWSIVQAHDVRDSVSEALRANAEEVLRDADRRVMKLRLVVATARLRGMVRANPLVGSWRGEESQTTIGHDILDLAKSALRYFESVAPPDEEQRLRAIDVLTTAEILLAREDPSETQKMLELAIADFESLSLGDAELRDSLQFNLCWVLWRQRELREALQSVNSLLAAMEARSYVGQLRPDALVLRSRIHAAVADFDEASVAMKEAETFAKQLALAETYHESTLPYVLATGEMLLGALRPLLAMTASGGEDDAPNLKQLLGKAFRIHRGLERRWMLANIAADELEKPGMAREFVDFGRGTVLHQQAILQFLLSQSTVKEGDAVQAKRLAREFWQECERISMGLGEMTPARRLLSERSRVFLAILDLQEWEKRAAEFWREVAEEHETLGTRVAESSQEAADRSAAAEKAYNDQRGAYEGQLADYELRRSKLRWFSSPWSYASVKSGYEPVKRESDRIHELAEELDRVRADIKSRFEEQERELAQFGADLRECLLRAHSLEQISAISSVGSLFSDDHEISQEAKALEAELARIAKSLPGRDRGAADPNPRLGFILGSTLARVARAQGREDAHRMLEAALELIEIGSAGVSEKSDTLVEFHAGFRFAYELLVDWCVEDAERAERLSMEAPDGPASVEDWRSRAIEARKQALVYAEMVRNRTFDREDRLKADSAPKCAFLERKNAATGRVNDYLRQCPATLYYHVGAARSYLFLIPPASGEADSAARAGEIKIVRLPSLGLVSGDSMDVLDAFPGRSGLTEGEVWRIVSDYNNAYAYEFWPKQIELLKAYGNCLLPERAREWITEQSESWKLGEGIVICPDADMYRLTMEGLILEAPEAAMSGNSANTSGARSDSPRFFADRVDRPTVYSLGLDPSLGARTVSTTTTISPRILIASHWNNKPIDVSTDTAGRKPVVLPVPNTDEEVWAASYEAEWKDVEELTDGNFQVVSEPKDVAEHFHVSTEEWLTNQLGKGRFTHVHLISHGKGPEGNQTKAYDHLVFASTNNRAGSGARIESTSDRRDGLLRLEEIGKFNLDGCELAVLSACGTNRGAVGRLEMPHGLSRAFLLAGARHVVASQWDVRSTKTARFMKDFYAAWVPRVATADTWDYAEALHRARRELRLELSPQPRDWAAFVLLYSPPSRKE